MAGAKVKSVKDSASAAVCLMLLIITLFVFPFKASAMNSDYADPERWIHSEDTVAVQLDYENMGRELEGYFFCKTDGSLCLYTCFKISESTLNEDNNNVSVVYDFHMQNEDFCVIADREGMSRENAPEETKRFDVIADFSVYGEYTSIVQYKGRDCESCTVDITLYINGQNYRITRNEKLYGKQISMETVTQTEAETTVSEKHKKKSAATKKESTTKKDKKESTTKFKPSYSITTGKKTAVGAEEAQTDTEDETALSEAHTEIAVSESFTQVKGERSAFSKALLVLGIALAAAGAAVLVSVALLGKEKQSSQNTDEEKE